MSTRRHTILIADDDRFIRDDLRETLKSLDCDLAFAATAAETWTSIVTVKPDLVLLDLRFPDLNDLSLLKRIKNEFPDTQVIILTSQTENLAQIVSAIKVGAFDYVGKPFIPEELVNRIEKALSLRQLSLTQRRLIDDLNHDRGLDCLIGESPGMQFARETIRRLAEVDGCVLVRGETGTGKELAARAIHYLSKRRSSPFIPINCAAIPENLLSSELFGHRRGAFTGAVDSARGKFDAAEDGTIFLDEIGDMPLSQQASLLRVLETRHYSPIGETKEKECLARFVFATNRDLKECIKEKTFREDLFYRVNVASVSLPSLKSRADDVPALVSHYNLKISAEMGRKPPLIGADVMAVFQRYDWPGNVRELKHVLEGALVMLNPQQDEITQRDLPAELLAIQFDVEGNLVRDDMSDKQALIEALRQCNGNQTEAAKALGVHRNTVRSKLRLLGLGIKDVH